MNIAAAALVLFIVGIIFGSFAGATVWRIRARRIADEATRGDEPTEPKDIERLRPLAAVTIGNDYSRCLQCGHRLNWFDMVPLLSWLTTAGRCRYCRAPIGRFEPGMELGLGLYFAASYFVWPYGLSSVPEMIHFALWLIAGVVMAVLFAYDFKWFILPLKANILLIATGLAVSGLLLYQAPAKLTVLMSIIGGVLVLGGLYYVLARINENWVGGGDSILGLGLALLLADWTLAFVALYAANVFGLLAVLPSLLKGKKGLKSRIPFGPFLILGAVTAKLFGSALIVWYSEVMRGLL